MPPPVNTVMSLPPLVMTFSPLPLAQVGAALTDADIARAAQWLLDKASELDPAIAAAPTVAQQRACMRLKARLLARAAQLNAGQIVLIAGEAAISAAHLDSAIDQAQAVITRIANVAKRLKVLGQVLDFFAAVLTGRGNTIVAAAWALHQQLEKA